MNSLLPISSALLGLLALPSGCGGSPQNTSADAGLMEVHFQTDWYAQAEHGGYYQAVAQGYFADLSMNVVIDQGGPGAYAVQKVATGKTAFAPWFLATTSCSPSDRVCRWSSSAP